MSLNASKIKGSTKFKPTEALEPGTFPSRLVQVIGLGLQKQDAYMGEPKPPRHKVWVTYELADEFMLDEDGKELEDKPRWVSEDFALFSLDSDLATSTKRYLAIDPAGAHGGDWAQLLGAPCSVTLVKNVGKGKNAGRFFNNVASVQTMRAKDVDKLPPLKNEGKVFDPSAPDMEVFASLPEFLQDRIKENLEYEGSKLQKLVEGQGKSSEGESAQTPENEPQTPPQDVSEASTDDEADW